MCGISGIINFNNQLVDEEELNSMLATMKHRGPDDQGIFIDENYGLGFVRLSIIDLTKLGHQPMHSPDNRYTVIFNGEIFNYKELKKELISLGVKFTTQTDTEVLLQAYINWGKDCLHRLNGMWAFAIYDKQEKELFATRDRFGIKPFYYHLTEDRFIFASEIPTLLTTLNQKPKANNNAIFDYLAFNRTDQDTSTFFENIFKLKHGHSITIKNSSTKINEWYNLKSNLKKPFQNKEEYKSLLIDSIRLRLRSDVPIGICFSGGLDSSSILSIVLGNFNQTNINTFSAVYKNGDIGDESEFINLYTNKLKNMHFITPSAETLFADMNCFIKAHAEPIPGTSPYAQFKTMQLAKKTVTVTLDGQGADEQLGGYHYFFGLYFKHLLKKLKWVTLTKELIAYKRIHKSNYGLKTFIYFLLPKFLRTNLRVSEKGYIDNSFYKKNKSNSRTAATIYNSNSLNQALLDHFEYKLEHLLKWEDRNSMYFSIEARVPFLDYRIVEKTLSLKPEMIIKNGTTKFILREAMKGVLPEKIRMRQDKIGFETPEAEWFRNALFKDFILELLNSNSFKSRKIINPDKAKKLYHKHLLKEIDISKEIWKWINLELWFREFIDLKTSC